MYARLVSLDTIFPGNSLDCKVCLGKGCVSRTLTLPEGKRKIFVRCTVAAAPLPVLDPADVPRQDFAGPQTDVQPQARHNGVCRVEQLRSIVFRSGFAVTGEVGVIGGFEDEVCVCVRS